MNTDFCKEMSYYETKIKRQTLFNNPISVTFENIVLVHFYNTRYNRLTI